MFIYFNYIGKIMKGFGRNTRFKEPHGYSGGGKPRVRKNKYANKGATEIGKENKVESYKEYIKRMFGGGET